MKKYIPYILIVILGAAIITLFITGGNQRKNKLDERLSLRKKDKLPYGTYVAYSTLPYLFPGAEITVNKQSPGTWETLSPAEPNQLLMIVSSRFGADEDEITKLIEFARNGNDVFISSVFLSAAADDMFDFNSSAYELANLNVKQLDENLRFTLSDPPFPQQPEYTYPGRTFSSYYTGFDTATSRVLGFDVVGRPNFIHLKTGKGNFFIHLEPLAFSNYFLLHKKNMEFYEQAMSLVRPGIKKITWDEYYRNKKEKQERPGKKDGWLSVLFRYPAFKAALLTAIFTLLVYVLMEMRRKQRAIPVLKKPKNESLDFVKTIGRLYYEKGDHRNLCRKMAAYFLEHVRNKYKLLTGTLDEEFIKNLHYKSGVGQEEIGEIVSIIKNLDLAETISPEQLTGFHKRLESFYKKT